MAAAVVTVVVEDLLQKLSQGMELGTQWGVEAQLLEIHDLLSSLQGYLPEAERKYPYSFELQERIRELKDAVYDAEDLLEDLSMEEPLRLRDGKLRRLFRHVESCWFGWRMRRGLGAIAGRLQVLTDPLIDIIRSISDEVLGVLEAHEIPLVWRVDENGDIIRLLLNGDSEVEICVSWRHGIIALVQEAMKDSRVSGYFDVKIWVNVSAGSGTDRMAQEITSSLKEEEDVEEGKVFGWEQSIHLLARLLDDSKRYLFVLDNMYDQDLDSQEWLRLRRLLEGRVASGSKILRISHRMPRLFGSDIQWRDREELIRETASQGRETVYHNLFNNPQFHEIAGHIVHECRGDLRLIKAVGGYLSLHPPAVENWTPLLNMLSDSQDPALSRLVRGGYPYGDLTSPGVKRYNNLPPRIKQCFALCYLFPRGHPINPHTLAQLWISLGFIHSNDHLPLEDIAYLYLDVLLQRELFQVKKSDIFGMVKSVILHPAVHEFAPSIAGWECLPQDLSYLVPKDFYAQQYARHQSVINYQTSIWPDYFPVNKLRTFLHFEEDRTKLEDMYHCLIPKLNPKRNRLRVLDIHDVKADVLTEGVWKLKHLRYLDLSGNTMLQMLPRAIIGLLNLQTLKLTGCSSLTELPRDISNLSALRHLYTDGCWKLYCIPKGLCDLKCLNILTDFILPPDESSKNVDYAGLTDLCKLNDLRGSLKIKNLGCYDKELMDEGSKGLLDRKSYLQSVELWFMNLPSDISLLENLQPHLNLKGLRIHNYGGTQFPKWMTLLSTHLPNLVEITLIGCENCMYLPRLAICLF